MGLTLNVHDNKRQGNWVVQVTNFPLQVEEDNVDILIVMQEWCLKNHCGRRMSYDQFWFKTKKQLNWFLLRFS